MVLLGGELKGDALGMPVHLVVAVVLVCVLDEHRSTKELDLWLWVSSGDLAVDHDFTVPVWLDTVAAAGQLFTVVHDINVIG